MDDNRREKLKGEIKGIDKDVLEYQRNEPGFKLRRQQKNGAWVTACRAAYGRALDWGDGQASVEPLLQTLANTPGLVEQLGFVRRPPAYPAASSGGSAPEAARAADAPSSSPAPPHAAQTEAAG